MRKRAASLSSINKRKLIKGRVVSLAPWKEYTISRCAPNPEMDEMKVISHISLQFDSGHIPFSGEAG